MKKSTLLMILTISAFSFLQMDCKDDSPIKPSINPLQLLVEDATCTEAFLKLSLIESETNRTVTLKRGDSTIATMTIAGKDSLFVEGGLLPSKTYIYTLSVGSWNATALIKTQDTTSHAVQWQMPDTLGAQGLIRDCWVFSRDNAWAVGEIFLRDSNGVIDNATRYNAARWDGNRWNLLQLKYNCRLYFPNCGPETKLSTPAMSIFAFNANDVWIAAGSAQHYNGVQWTEEAGIQGVGSANRIWGVSGEIWFVGDSGFIAHRNSNGVWTKMDSHTTVDLQDIWGIDDTHIWATGFNNNDGHCILLKYDGKQWTTIYDNTNSTPSTLHYFNTLWTDNINYLYLDGGSYTQFLNLHNGTFHRTDSLTKYTMSRLRGTKRNDIVRVGFGGETVHFNGYSWFLYPELKELNGGYAGFSSVYLSKDFVLIGGLYLTALNGFPVVVRGYR